MTREKWNRMSHEEHVAYWDRHYSILRAIFCPIGSAVGIIAGYLIAKWLIQML